MYAVASSLRYYIHGYVRMRKCYAERDFGIFIRLFFCYFNLQNHLMSID